VKKLDLLQVGETGAGKSLRSLDATRWGRVLLIDVDNKYNPTSSKYTEAQVGLVDAYKVIRVDLKDRFNDTEGNYVFGSQGVVELIKEANKQKKYSTLILDTFSVINSIIEIEVRNKFKLKEEDKLEHGGWAMVSNRCRAVFDEMFYTPLNVIINNHVDQDKDIEGRAVIGLAGRGGFVKEIPKLMTHTQYLYFDGTKHQIKAARSLKFPVNSDVNPKFMNTDGTLKVSDLSIFDDCAYRAQ
jgi:hypothetical protein